MRTRLALTIAVMAAALTVTTHNVDALRPATCGLSRLGSPIAISVSVATGKESAASGTCNQNAAYSGIVSSAQPKDTYCTQARYINVQAFAGAPTINFYSNEICGGSTSVSFPDVDKNAPLILCDTVGITCIGPFSNNNF
jgi:hypothetical protein